MREDILGTQIKCKEESGLLWRGRASYNLNREGQKHHSFDKFVIDSQCSCYQNVYICFFSEDLKVLKSSKFRVFNTFNCKIVYICTIFLLRSRPYIKKNWPTLPSKKKVSIFRAIWHRFKLIFVEICIVFIIWQSVRMVLDIFALRKNTVKTELTVVLCRYLTKSVRSHCLSTGYLVFA